jgi:hypothetical protein
VDRTDVRELALRLAGPEGLTAFNLRVREQRVAKFSGALASEDLAALFGLARLEEALERDSIPASQIDVFGGTHLVRLNDLLHKTGQNALNMIAEQLRQGATVRVRDLEQFDHRLGAFAAAVRVEFAADVQINLYITPPHQAGFPPHFDTTDVFVLQLAGSKLWHLYPDYAGRIALPTLDTPWEPDRYVPTSGGEVIELRRGDVLYVPRGGMHAASCRENESLHLTISISSLTFADLLARAVKRFAKDDIRLRRRVPWSAHREHAPSQLLDGELRELLQSLSEQIDVTAILAEERARLALSAASSTGVLARALGRPDGEP